MTLKTIQKDHAERLGLVEGSDAFDAHREGFKLAAFLVNSFISDTFAVDGVQAGVEAMATVYHELLEMNNVEDVVMEVQNVVH